MKTRCSFCTGSGWIISHGNDWEERPPLRRCQHCNGSGVSSSAYRAVETEIKILEEARRLIESEETTKELLESPESWLRRILRKATESVLQNTK